MCFALLPTKLSYYHYVLPILVDRSYFKCVNQYKSQTQTHARTHARTQASARSLTRTHALTHAYKHTHTHTHTDTHTHTRLFKTVYNWEYFACSRMLISDRSLVEICTFGNTSCGCYFVIWCTVFKRRTSVYLD